MSDAYARCVAQLIQTQEVNYEYLRMNNMLVKQARKASDTWKVLINRRGHLTTCTHCPHLLQGGEQR